MYELCICMFLMEGNAINWLVASPTQLLYRFAKIVILFRIFLQTGIIMRLKKNRKEGKWLLKEHSQLLNQMALKRT